ncbi:MAG TPA: hypothetical protein VG713_05350 [Pirellulales bacterium]|nr:hypothetical protein [Pirellulales bacterium]
MSNPPRRSIEPRERARHRIVVLTGNHLCHNPRVIKEADALAAAGYEVEVLGAWIDESLAQRDRELMARRGWKFTVVADTCRGSVARRFRRATGSLEGRWRRRAYLRRGRLHPHLLGRAAIALAHAALKRDASLFIAHSEQALWVAQQLLEQGKCVGVDMEDWFSEDLLPEARRTRPVAWLAELERELLARGTYRICTSAVMSDALAGAYAVAPPDVVYNVFPWADRAAIDGLTKDRRDRARVSIHWFSQTLGRGRGLGDLLRTLPLLKEPVEVHLRGTPASDWESTFHEACDPAFRPWVTVHPLVSNEELLSRIAEHDVGFAGEETYCRSRELTVTNKLFQYLLGGLAIAASNTLGQCEIAADAGEAVQIYASGDVQALAGVVNRWIDDRSSLARARQAALTIAQQRYSWEREAPQVVSAADQAIFARATTC